MIYDYVNTKPPLEEVYLEHGWLKDQAAKAHKYIERWRGKNGKWYYRYKSKALESATKFANKAVGINDPRSVVNNKKPSVHWFPLLGSSKGRNVVWADNGKANSRSGQTGSRVKGTTTVSSKISRKPKKKGNLTSRGYSNSKSSSNNKATEKKIARREHMDYLKSNSVRNTRYGWKENSNGIIIDRETGKRYTPYRRRRKINK